jgi:hypothetical protein
MIQPLKSNLKSLLRNTSIISCLAVFCSVALNASDFSIKPIDKAPPSNLGESIKAELSDKALVILQKDKPVYELWLRKELPLKTPITSSAKALASVGQASLLGAITVVADERDYRDDELYKGVYTIRFGLRPEDGNHLGTSEHLFFAVLIDAENDQELVKIVKTKQLVKASSKTSATDHPMILSLFPVKQSDAVTPSIHEPALEHEAIRLSIPAKSQDGSDAGSVVFDLVIAGLADF